MTVLRASAKSRFSRSTSAAASVAAFAEALASATASRWASVAFVSASRAFLWSSTATV
ncbi:hypothetical protein N7U49_35675 [Streptomyces sp. AD2-2]|nr:hypothetical protein N7U49_35675 [Streptomyces sp. AD2-2]